MKTKSKIFCIGLNKTGTSSLDEAFKILGFKSVHFNCNKGNIKNIIEKNYKNGDTLLLGIEDYDAYSDWNNPNTCYLYKEFDKVYPNSKFILNTRNFEDWLLSREKHLKKKPNLKELQKKHPDSAWYNIDKEAWTKEWQEVHEDIITYFKDRPEDLLIINVPSGEGWEKLCPFLGVPIPNQTFPQKNKTPNRIKIIIFNYKVKVRQLLINLNLKKQYPKQ